MTVHPARLQLRPLAPRVRLVSILAPLALAAGLLAGCGPTEPLELDTIQLGRGLNPDNSVSGHTSNFKPLDTQYVSVLTKGKGRGTIGVRWMYEGRLVGEPSQQVVYRDAAATEFHITNSSGFPPGSYSVEVFIDGKSVGKRDYKVDKE